MGSRPENYAEPHSTNQLRSFQLARAQRGCNGGEGGRELHFWLWQRPNPPRSKSVGPPLQRYGTQSAAERKLPRNSHLSCASCNKSSPEVALKQCAKCLGSSTIRYCSRDCQRADWKVHKKVCGKLKPPSTQHDPPSYNAGGPYSEPKDLGSPTNQPPRDTTINKAESVQGLQGVVTSLNNEVLESASRPYTIRAIAGKGKGLVATRKIAKGKWILSELPIFTLPKRLDIRALEHQVAKEVESLNDDHRRAFFDLTNIHGNAYSQPFGIAKTNALPLGSNASSVGLFLDASRINHSCRHNAQNNWNENIGRLTIHALRDIEEGQEITIHYMGSTGEYEERQRFLREKFRFDCKCQLCSLPLAQRNLSDARLREIQVIDRVIGEFCRGGDFKPETALKLLHRMFRLFDEESIWDASIARAYKDAYDIARCIENGGESRARVFAERTYAARCVAEGNDSPVAQKMKQAAEELSSAKMPQGMNDGEFKNWLWMLDG